MNVLAGRQRDQRSRTTTWASWSQAGYLPPLLTTQQPPAHPSAGLQGAERLEPLLNGLDPLSSLSPSVRRRSPFSLMVLITTLPPTVLCLTTFLSLNGPCSLSVHPPYSSFRFCSEPGWHSLPSFCPTRRPSADIKSAPPSHSLSLTFSMKHKAWPVRGQATSASH